jgi:hypothetical protein
MSLSIFLFLSELGTCLQNLIPHKRCGTLRKKSFSAWGYAEIHIQRPFFDNKQKRHIKNHCIENPNGEHILECFLYA